MQWCKKPSQGQVFQHAQLFLLRGELEFKLFMSQHSSTAESEMNSQCLCKYGQTAQEGQKSCSTGKLIARGQLCHYQ